MYAGLEAALTGATDASRGTQGPHGLSSALAAQSLWASLPPLDTGELSAALTLPPGHSPRETFCLT